jgi:hypothetical protein
VAEAAGVGAVAAAARAGAGTVRATGAAGTTGVWRAAGAGWGITGRAAGRLVADGAGGAGGGRSAVVAGRAAAAVTPAAGATTIVSSVPPGTIAVVTAPARSSTSRVTGGSAELRATRTRRTIARPVSAAGTAPGDTPGRSTNTWRPSVVGVAVARQRGARAR